MIAALHTGQRQTRREITGRLLTAMENENVDIIAHPTGRIIGKREEYDVDIEVPLPLPGEKAIILPSILHQRQVKPQ